MGSIFNASRTAAAAATATLCLLVAPAARPDQVPPLVELGPVAIANGTAILSGKVGGANAATLDLAVNGQPLAIDGGGNFAATVALNGANVLTLSLRDSLTGDASTATLPLTLAIGGLIPPGTLAAVEAALAGLPKPPDGLAVFDGRPLKLTGRILNRSELASLTVNGVDVLKLLSPTGSFALQLPATTKTVSAAVTDTRGASATASYPVAHVTSRRQASSVKAAEAVGLRIARIRYLMRGVVRTHRLRMIVTVKDRAGRVVQGAAVRVRVKKRGLTSTRTQAKRTARTGNATFAIKVRRRGLGKRLFIVTAAKTPSASATRTTSVRVPAARHVRGARRR